MRPLWLGFIVACSDKGDSDPADDSGIDLVDADLDGYGTPGDCDDGDASIHPNADEICDDGIDQDCDDVIDDCEGELAEGWSGAEAGTQLGKAVSGAGDLDQDGKADILVGAPGTSTSAGRVYVLLGPADDGLTGAVATLEGATEGDVAGSAVAAAGDVDGDGNADIVVGAPKADPRGGEMGVVYVVSGPVAGTISLAEAEGLLNAPLFFDWLGTSLDGAGDIDGDGYDDLVIGAPGDHITADGAGAAYIVRGPVQGEEEVHKQATTILGDETNIAFGTSVAGLGDVSGDGIPDVAVGAIGVDEGGVSSGVALVFYGPAASPTMASADARLVGDGDNAYAGSALSEAGDLDGDGVMDVVVGGYGKDAFAGIAWIVSGPVSGTLSLSNGSTAVLHGEESADFLGYSVAGNGDFDGDGNGDLVVGAWGADPSTTIDDAGAAYVVFGPMTGTIKASTKMPGLEAGDHAGYAVAMPGDVDGDGLDDVLVGAPDASPSGNEAAGEVYLLLGGSL